MSGHSKWANIKHKKEKTDAQRAKVFTKIGKEITIAVKEGGGPDPSANSRLRDVIAKAKSLNVPNDNIERSIKKAAGDGNTNNYEDIVYFSMMVVIDEEHPDGFTAEQKDAFYNTFVEIIENSAE